MCPKCSTTVDKNVKFYPECGESLVKKCLNCSATIKGIPQFCGECGEKLES